MLEALLSPVSVASFLATHFGQRCLHTTAAAEAFRALAGVPALRSPQALAALPAKGQCFSFRHENWLPRVSELPPAEALAEYEQGCSFYLGKVEQGVPELAAACHGIADALGVPRVCVSAQAFASRAGHGLDLHFDHDDNFSLQVSGRKVWRTGPNDLVKDPLKSSFWGAALFREIGLSSGQEPPLPRLETFEAGPGALVYVPRSFWHTTRCLEDSVSISFAVRPPYAFQVVLAAVQRRLAAEPVGRAFAVGLTRGGTLNRTFTDALPALLESIRSLRPEDCQRLEATPPPLSRRSMLRGCFRPGPRAVCDAQKDPRVQVVLADGRLAPLVVPPRWQSTVWSLLDEEVFVLDEGLARRHGWPVMELERLVDEMVGREILERIA